MEGDSNARQRERRRRRRRQVRRRRLVALIVLLAFGGGAVFGARAGGHRSAAAAKIRSAPRRHRSSSFRAGQRPRPAETRGVHVTVALASLAGRIADYARIPGLNTIELDVKDENGKIGFVPSEVPLARDIGAAQPYYHPRLIARFLHRRGIYLIGRVVTFEDPVLSEARPALAVQTAGGGVWHTRGGLGWTNPYDQRVWRYDVDVAVAAARAGFDEIQFDYVRFPSDGDLSSIRYPGLHPQPMGWTTAAFVQYAARRLHPLGVRVSVDVFGLSATRDLGIGQFPRRVSAYVDALSPMVYPSHYNQGELGIPNPNAAPGLTVARSLGAFERSLLGRKAVLVPWLQDFSLGRAYQAADVEAQIAATRAFHTGGFLLWNAGGIYTDGVLAAGSG